MCWTSLSDAQKGEILKIADERAKKPHIQHQREQHSAINKLREMLKRTSKGHNRKGGSTWVYASKLHETYPEYFPNQTSASPTPSATFSGYTDFPSQSQHSDDTPMLAQQQQQQQLPQQEQQQQQQQVSPGQILLDHKMILFSLK